MFYNKIKKVVSVLCLMVFMVNILPSVKVSATPYYSECKDNVSYSLKKNTVGLNIATVKGRISSIGKVTFCKWLNLVRISNVNRMIKAVYINNEDLRAIMATLAIEQVTVAAIVASLDVIAATIATTFPVLGWLTGGILATYGTAFAVVAVQAVIEGRGIHIRICFPWGLSFDIE